MDAVRLVGVALMTTLIAGAASALPDGPPICGRCGPAPGYPSWSCADGRHQGGRGPCIERADGSCGFIRLVCPEDRAPDGRDACSPAECGAPPAIARWSCPGRAQVGEFGVCKRDREGRCGWVYAPCSGHAQQVVPTGPFAPPPPPRPAPPPPRPTPAATRHCGDLRDTDRFRTWEVVGVCRPGGGPAPPPIVRLRSLGDGTFVFSGRSGCFRGRYIRCFSK
jgi:hypothetical protein